VIREEKLKIADMIDEFVVALPRMAINCNWAENEGIKRYTIWCGHVMSHDSIQQQHDQYMHTNTQIPYEVAVLYSDQYFINKT
jgi:hypothetical protein